jgi:hypothetical protein
MAMTQTEPRCRRCGADALASRGHFERRLRLGREPDAAVELLRLCGPCARDLDDDEHRVEYLRLGLLV